MNINESTTENRMFLDNKLVEFNNICVPFKQKDPFVSLSFILKDENDRIMGGINADLYCWNIMYVDVLYIE